MKQQLRIKHTHPVALLDYKHPDGKTPVKIGETVEMSHNMAKTLVALGWGHIVDKEGNNLSEKREQRMIAAEVLASEASQSESEKARAEVIAAIKAVTEEGKE